MLLALQPGCGTVPTVPNTQYQATVGRVAVITTPAEPAIDFSVLTRGKTEGAARGAGSALLSCVGAFGPGGCSGEFCGPVIILWLGVCGVAGAAGGIAGAVAAPGTDTAKFSRHTLSTALNVSTIQASLRNLTEAAALAGGVSLVPLPAASTRIPGDYRPLADAEVNTLLEVTLTGADMTGAGINEPTGLRMQAHVRVIRTRDNSVIFSTDYVYMGEKLKPSEWSANRAARLLAGLETGYKTLGTHIIENTFLLYPFPDRQPHASGFLSSAFGLAPVYPPTRGQLTGEPLIGNRFEWTSVDTLRPTLRWQGFPRSTDIEAAREEMGRITNVRYDLVIAREQNLAPAGIVYRREGLPATRHTIETSLSPATRYFWTVRARFELDGRERVTEWGSTHFMARERWTAPSHLSYRFKTP
jgi:hypothetical protein